jgi:phospholipase/carboxylesterase
MQDALIVQRPAATARYLVLLFHGVGASPEGLRPLGAAVARHFKDALVVSVRSPEASDFGSGWQWFSVRGVDEANRPARVAAAMPRFVQTIQHWQGETGLGPADTTLIGFSQGAIMSLEATQQDVPLAGRVIAVAGRFAQPPRLAPLQTALHLMHGDQDAVMPPALSARGVEQLQVLGSTATLDLFPGLAHGIDQRVLDRIVERMQDRVVETS